MILDIHNGMNEYSINIERLTQFLGVNIVAKDTVIEILTRYFSTSKYAEWENMPNVEIQGEELGRKYFTTYLISGRADLINQIKNLKTGMIMRLIKLAMNEFEYQKSMEKISDELQLVFSNIEMSILTDLGNIAISFESENLFNIIQKSYIETRDGKQLEQLDNKELVEMFINTLIKLQEYEPEKMLIVLKNIDHLIDIRAYEQLIDRIKELSETTDSWCILSTSINGYCVVDNELMEGITVFNDAMYNLPDANHMKGFLEDNYPYLVNLNNKLFELLKYAIPYIGLEKPFISYDSMICVKLINETLQMKNVLENPANSMVTAFLAH